MFGPPGFWTMAPLHYTAKFDPFSFLGLRPPPPPSTLAQSKERKGSNFAIWQPCFQRICKKVDDISALSVFPQKEHKIITFCYAKFVQFSGKRQNVEMRLPELGPAARWSEGRERVSTF